MLKISNRDIENEAARIMAKRRVVSPESSGTLQTSSTTNEIQASLVSIYSLVLHPNPMVDIAMQRKVVRECSKNKLSGEMLAHDPYFKMQSSEFYDSVII